MRPCVRVLSLCLLAAVALSATGCWRHYVWHRRHHGPVVVTPPGPVVVTPPAAEIIVETEPPPPRVEVRPPCPVVGHVWTAGYWNWVGGKHVWVAGRWVPPPRAGAVWVPHRWDRGPRGWRHIPGHWR